jgi:paraquat-inducible protein B
MSKLVNPYTLSAFLVGFLVTLLIAAIPNFNGGQLPKKATKFIIYFDDALNGLNVGAPVKFQGVQIGSVKEISPETSHKAVVIEINPEGMLKSIRMFSNQPLRAATPKLQRRAEYHRLIARGVKAKLQAQSVMVGLLYVELDFFPDKPVRLTGHNYQDLPELPSVPTTAM